MAFGITDQEAETKLRGAAMRLGLYNPMFLLPHAKVRYTPRPGYGTLGISPTWEIVYDPKVIAETPGPELGVIIAHELMHCITDHHERGRGRSEQIQINGHAYSAWNVATDMVINQSLKDAGVGIIPDAFYPPGDYHGPLAAEALYGELTKRADQNDDPAEPGTPDQPSKPDEDTEPDEAPKPGQGCALEAPEPEEDESDGEEGDEEGEGDEGGGSEPGDQDGDPGDGEGDGEGEEGEEGEGEDGEGNGEGEGGEEGEGEGDEGEGEGGGEGDSDGEGGEGEGDAEGDGEGEGESDTDAGEGKGEGRSTQGSTASKPGKPGKGRESKVDPRHDPLNTVDRTQMRAQAQAIARGLPGLGSALADFIAPKPRAANWRKVLDRAASVAGAGTTPIGRSYSRPNRRNPMRPGGILNPGTRKADPRIAVLIDVSSSMDREWVMDIAAHILGIMKQRPGLDVFVASHTTELIFAGWIKPSDKKKIGAAIGASGGTRAEPAYAAAREASRKIKRPFDVLIHFTDAEIESPWPTPIPAKKFVLAVYGGPMTEKDLYNKPPPGTQIVPIVND